MVFLLQMGIRGKGLKPVRAKAGAKKKVDPIYKTKPVGGEKNGETRKVRINKLVNSLP